MGYYDEDELRAVGFRSLGRNVKVSDRAAIYDADQISIGDNSRIDDFCVLAGRIDIGRNVHVTVFCNLAGGRAGIELGDFATLAYGCHIVAQTDDYSGATMTNSTVPAEYKNETSALVTIGEYAILGTGCIVLPGVLIANGVAGGAGAVFTKQTDPWSIYVGTPARRIGPRQRKLLDHAHRYVESERTP